MENGTPKTADLGEGLVTLLNVFFHADWDVEADTADEVLDNFIAGTPSELVEQAYSDALALAAKDLPEELLQQRLDDMGLVYVPAYEGRTHREWLRHVIARLSGAASARRHL